MDELALQGAGEALVEGEWGFEAAGMDFLRVKFSSGAEFLYSFGGISKLLPGEP